MSLDRLTRYPSRGSNDRALLDALLDEQWWGTLATVSADGEPWMVPMLFARDGDRILLHGSTGAGALRNAATGAPVAFGVTVMDAVVVGHNAFDSSANYRSAVVRGRLVPVTDDAGKAALFDRLTNALLPERMAEVAAHTGKELAATRALALEIVEGGWTFKQRAGQAGAPDAATSVWGGVVPIVRSWGEPQRAPWSQAELPASVTALLQRNAPA